MKSINPSGHGAYQILKKWFLKHYRWELSQRVTHKNLTPVFVDDQDRTYYEFGEAMGLPMCRYLKMEEFQTWLQSNIDGGTLNEMVETAQNCMIDALKAESKTVQANALSKVNAILQQVKDRQARVVPIDLVVNILCAQIVREDEDPHEWNQIIHMEKCDFMKEHLTDYQFFFHLTAFRKLRQLQIDSAEKWVGYLARATAEAKHIKETMKVYSRSAQSSKSGNKT